jgi:hypothetical protein
MRIISPYKDYYDGVQRSDAEGFPLYKRVETEVKDAERGYYNSTRMLESNNYSRYETFTIGVAGKIYQGYRAIGDDYTNYTYHPNDESNNKVFYDLEEFVAFLDSENCLEETGRWSRKGHIEKKLRKNHDIINKLWYESLFLKYRVPVFLFHDGKFLLNPKLDKVKFGKIKDSYTVYQDIDMFLGNELAQANDPEMPVGSDVVIAESKGYNKQSFRMESSTKKRKIKKKNK